MNARFDAERTRRWLGFAGAAAVMAIPIAFIAVTWEPLEPAPRAERSTLVEDAATPERTREERRGQRGDDAGEERGPRRDRNRERDATPAIGTPRP